MRFLFILILLFSYYSSSSQSQLEWEEIEIPLTYDISIIYKTQEGHLLAQQKGPSQIQISKDNGSTWEFFYSGPLFTCKKNPIVWNEIKELKKGEFYWEKENIIYKYSEKDKTFFPFIEIDRGLKGLVFKFDVISDGNILVTTKNRLLLYNYKGEEIRNKKHNLRTSYLSIIPTDKDYFYVRPSGRPASIIKVSNDLQSISEKINTPSSYIGGIKYQKNTLFTSYEYSKDEGQTWKKLPFPNKHDVIYYNIESNGDLIFAGHSGISISKDNANSFKSYDLPILGFRPEFVTLINKNKMLLSEIHPYKSQGFEYNLKKEQYSKIENSTKTAYASKVWAGTKGNMLISDGKYISHLKKSKTEDWEKVNITTQEDPTIKQDINWLNSFPNGELIGTNMGRTFVSFDYGNSWKLEEKIPRPNKIIQSQGKLFFFSTGGDLYEYETSLKRMKKLNQKDNVLADYRIIAISKSNTALLTPNNKTYLYTFCNLSNFKIKSTPSKLDIPYANHVMGMHDRDGFLFIHERKHEQSVHFFVTNDKGEEVDQYQYKFDSSFEVEPIRDKLLFAWRDNTFLISYDFGKTWVDHSPNSKTNFRITSAKLSPDNYIYISAENAGVFKSKNPIL